MFLPCRRCARGGACGRDECTAAPGPQADAPAARISAWRPPAATGTPWTASHEETWTESGLLPPFPSAEYKNQISNFQVTNGIAYFCQLHIH